MLGAAVQSGHCYRRFLHSRNVRGIEREQAGNPTVASACFKLQIFLISPALPSCGLGEGYFLIRWLRGRIFSSHLSPIDDDPASYWQFALNPRPRPRPAAPPSFFNSMRATCLVSLCRYSRVNSPSTKFAESAINERTNSAVPRRYRPCSNPAEYSVVANLGG